MMTEFSFLWVNYVKKSKYKLIILREKKSELENILFSDSPIDMNWYDAIQISFLRFAILFFSPQN